MVTFNVTPLRQTFIRSRVNFKNGINSHTTTLTIPLSTVVNHWRQPGAHEHPRDRTAGGDRYLRRCHQHRPRYRPLGDRHDAGRGDPVDPYKVYVVGSLEPDDIASFDVTFIAKATVGEVPLLVTYKDDEGNIITTTSSVEINSQAFSDQSSEPSRFTNLLIWMFVIVIAAVFIYFWRRG